MKKNVMKSARWEILATDAEESGTTPGNVPQPKAKAKAKARAKAKAKAKASTEPGPKDGNGQGKERAWAKVKARLDCRVSATDAVSMAIVSPVARNGRLLRLSKMEKLKPRKKPCKWLVYIGTLDVFEVKPKIKMTNRFAVLEEEDDCKMAPSRFDGNI